MANMICIQYKWWLVLRESCQISEQSSLTPNGNYLDHFLYLTHWGRVTHICVGKQTIIGSDNGLSPGRRQAIIWTNAGILLSGSLGTNFSEISIKMLTFSFTKMRLKVSSAKWRPSCLGLNVLTDKNVDFSCWIFKIYVSLLYDEGKWIVQQYSHTRSELSPQATQQIKYTSPNLRWSKWWLYQWYSYLNTVILN